MLREQKLDIFEDLYIEATRYAKEIHKKVKSDDYDKNSDSIRVGKNRYGRNLLRQQTLGGLSKRSHPGYKKGEPDCFEKPPGSILRKQMEKDKKKGKEPSKKQLEEETRSLNRDVERLEKFSSYYKNSNHGRSKYNQKTDFSKI